LSITPQLLLFMSIDIVGSTAYKNSTQRDKSDIHPWRPTIQSFFIDFPIDLVKTNDVNKPKLNCSDFAPPKIWKFLGDEIVFYVELKHSSHLSYYLENTKKLMNIFCVENFKEQKLKLKGAAWVSGFPVANTMMKFSIDKRITTDYFGRSIDAGFRLAKIATAQKFVLSIQTAWMLSQISSDIDIYYDGRTHLKGILNGDQYPIFWILSDTKAANELDLLHIKPSGKEIIAEFGRRYIEDNGWGLPFIEGDKAFSYKDPDYEDRLARASSLDEKSIDDEGIDFTGNQSVILSSQDIIDAVEISVQKK